MKITILKNEKSNDKDQLEKYIDLFKNKDEGKFYLHRSNETEFISFKDSAFKDMKNIFLIFEHNGTPFSIKGNLSISERENYEIKFYPFFVDKFAIEKIESSRKISLTERKSSLTLERYNFTEYRKLEWEFIKDEYKPIGQLKFDAGWKNFIEPYKYFIDLKEKILIRDFESFNNFNDHLKVISIDAKSEYYQNFAVRSDKDIIFSIEDNINSIIAIDHNKFQKQFSKDFLEKNTFFLSTANVRFSDKNKMQKVEEWKKIKDKIMKRFGKFSFFAVDLVSSNELLDLQSIQKYIENKSTNLLDLEKFFISEIYQIDDVIELKINELDDLNRQIGKSIEINNFNDLTNNVKKMIDKNDKVISTIDSFLKNIISNLGKNRDIISLEDLDKVDEIYNSIDQLNLIRKTTTYNNYLNMLKEHLNKSISIWKDEVNNFEKQNEDDEELPNEIKMEIERLELWKEMRFSEYSDKLSDYFINLKKDLAKQIKEDNTKNVNNIKAFIDAFKDISIKTREYAYDIKVLSNIKKENEYNNYFNAIYMINTGDYVLVDTLKQIIKKIDRKSGYNNDILLKLIGEKDMNQFEDSLMNQGESISSILQSYNKLNESQKKAFRLAIDSTDPIAIIQGPPGTGKTEVITEIIKYYWTQNKKVLVSSQTNVAIANVLDKLTDKTNIANSFLSIWLTTNQKNQNNSILNISDTWYEKIFDNLQNSSSKWNQFKEVFNNSDLSLDKETDVLSEMILQKDVKVFGATTTTSTTLSRKDEYKYIKDVEVLIIDEVSKSILPEILRYALDVEKVILVGDYKQLNPIFDISESDFGPNDDIDEEKFKSIRNIIRKGIFYKLTTNAEKNNRVATLNENYRSIPGVLDTYNIFYKDNNGNDGLKAIRDFKEFTDNYHFDSSIYFKNDKNFYFFNLINGEEKERGTSRYNEFEIEKIIEVLDDLSNSLINANDKSIAIIFPYAAQINLFNDRVRKKISKYRNIFKEIKWDTVDSFQGSEANIVILSTVITDIDKPGFLSDARRVNVALSRAKDMLLVFGNEYTLSNLEIKSDGIKVNKYFQKILNPENNSRLEIIWMEREEV